MLTKFWNSESGKVFKTTIIAWLVFLLTFANVFVLVPYVMNSYAADVNLENQGTKTNEDNVEFKAYFKQDETETFEIAKKMNEELILNLAVSVKNGFLVNGKIDFENSNFVYKETGESFVNLPQIDSKDANFEIPIKIKKIDSVNLNYFNMTCQIKLNGTYVVNNSEEKPVEATKYVKVEWQSVETEKPIISQEIITNKVLNIAGENKRIIQLKVNTKLAQILYPIGQNYLEINVPKFGDIQPEKVNVMAYETKLTNEKGKEAFSKENYSYSQENNVLEISVNNEADENENIYWANENLEDSFVITYIYDENVNIENTTSKITDSLALHDGTTLENENEISLENLEEKENVILLKEYTSNPIYKGNMYIGGTTSYDVLTDICVTYKNAAEALAIESTPETVGIIDNGKTVIEAVNSQITSTKIDAKQAKNLLGEDGEITISTKGENPEELSKIKLSEHSEDIIEVSYENPVSEIQITTSNVVKEGRIKVQHSKQIIIEEKTQEEIQKFEGLYTATKVSTTGTTQTSSQTNSRAELKEPETAIELSVDKTEINTLSENEIGLRTVLKSNSSKYKLFKNPTIEIELPSEITDAVIDNNQLAYAENELTIKNSEITTNENGNKVLKIELEGEQTKYSKQDGINIVTDLKLKSNKLIADKSVDIIATCINNGTDRAQDKNVLELKSKLGLINENVIRENENIVSTVNEEETTINLSKEKNEKEIKIRSTIVNNFKTDLKNITIIGKIPTEDGLNVGRLKEELKSLNSNKVYYSEKENTDINSSEWKEQVENYSNIKEFRIELENDLKKGEILQLEYSILLPSIIQQQKLVSTLKISYNLNGQNLSKSLVFNMNNENSIITDNVDNDNLSEDQKTTEITDKLKTEMFIISNGEIVTNDTVIKEGQMLEYKVSIKNISKEPLNNIKINATKENGTFYSLVFYDYNTLEDMIPTYVYDEDTSKTDETLTKETLEPGENIDFTYKIVANSNTRGQQLISNVEIASNDEKLMSLNRSNFIEEADIKVKVKYGHTENVNLNSNEDMKFLIEITNISSETLTNITIESKLPDTLKYLNNSLENRDLLITEGQNLKYNINELKSKETVQIPITARVNPEKFSYDKIYEDISIQAKATIEDKEYKSNILTKRITQGLTKLDINVETDKQDLKLKDGDIVTYYIKIKNSGIIETNAEITNNLSDGFVIQEVTLISEDNKIQINKNSDTSFVYSYDLKPQEEATIQIKAKVDTNNENNVDENLKNEIEIIADTTEEYNKEIIYQLEEIKTPEDEKHDDLLEPEDVKNNEEKENAIDPALEDDDIDRDTNDQEDTGKTPSDDIDEKNKYAISGIAWIDENKNGIREESEEVLPAIKVLLLDENGKQILDENKQAIYTMTSVLGTYKFSNLESGNYIVAFAYDTDKYKITKYKVENAEETTNSDAIAKKITIDGTETDVGITDVIKVEGTNVANIDIGLAKNPKSKLVLNKYIEKVVVNNNGGTATYTYKNTDFAKVEISAKYLDSSNVAIEYAINITNDGDVTEYVSDVVDYFPKELTFNSEMNSEWYKESDGNLHNINLTEEEINPGETKTIKIIATKTLDENGTGTIENIAEIGANSNLENVKNETSTPGNKQDGEDDMSKATLLISIKTGGVALYINIFIICSIILFTGIYLINKKIIKA